MISTFFYNLLAGYLPPILAEIGSVVGVFIVGIIIVLNIPLLLGWVDRKLSGRIQSRYGPVYTGPFGLLQNVADVIKLLGKRFITNQSIDKLIYDFIPIALSVLAALMIFVIPLGSPGLILVSIPYNLLFIYIFLALSPLLVLLAGWGQNNKYAMLSGFRGAAQITAYELTLLMALISIGILAGSYDISSIVNSQHTIWNAAYLPITLVLFVIASLAITERAPFDVPEASQELQAGWKIEYSGIRYGLFFIAEYVRLLVVSMLIVYLFFGGWNGVYLPDYAWFWIKTTVVTLFMMSLRWVYNRPRIDQLIDIGFKWLLPLSVINLIAVGFIAVY